MLEGSVRGALHDVLGNFLCLTKVINDKVASDWCYTECSRCTPLKFALKVDFYICIIVSGACCKSRKVCKQHQSKVQGCVQNCSDAGDQHLNRHHVHFKGLSHASSKQVSKHWQLSSRGHRITRARESARSYSVWIFCSLISLQLLI